MSNCIIKFWKINLKFLLPICLAFLQVVFIIINKYYTEEHNNLIFQLLAHSIGEMLIKLLPCILKISLNDIKKKKHLPKLNKIMQTLYFIMRSFYR